MKRKIIIADDEQLICSMLTKIIRTEELELEIAGIAYDGETLLKMIEETGADIAITDICMPKMDGLEVIQRASASKLPCKFLVISGYRQFEYAYNALKYNVDDYILKPIDAEELNLALHKIIRSLSKSGVQNKMAENNAASRHFFFVKAMYEISSSPVSVEDCNKTYGTTFQEGMFQAVFFKLDHIADANLILENFASLRNKMEDYIKTLFGPACFDILYEIKVDGILILLNYPLPNTVRIKSFIKESLGGLQHIIDLFDGLNLTICAGTPYTDLSGAARSKSEARGAEWMRMALGVNKVIFYREADHPISLQKKFSDLDIRLNAAYESLNISEFKSCMEELFSLPHSALYRVETRDYILHVCDIFFTKNRELIALFADEDILQKDVHTALRCATSFKAYRECFIRQFTGILEQIADTVSRRGTKPVRLAVQYIENNFDKPLSLEVVAAEVNLHPVYFSNIFKKETGQNFTDYVTNCRIEKAKELLREGELNINEIASSLGYGNARYFSRLFKKTVGIKPTEYRKIFG